MRQKYNLGKEKTNQIFDLYKQKFFRCLDGELQGKNFCCIRKSLWREASRMNAPPPSKLLLQAKWELFFHPILQKLLFQRDTKLIIKHCHDITVDKKYVKKFKLFVNFAHFSYLDCESIKNSWEFIRIICEFLGHFCVL